MEIENAVEEIAHKLGFNTEDTAIKKYGARCSVTWSSLVRAFILSGSIKETAKYLGYTNDSLEHYMARHLKKLLPSRTTNITWKNTFLSVIEHKSCSKCNLILPYTDFSKDVSHTDNLANLCRSCDNKKAANYRLTNNSECLSILRNNYYLNKYSYFARNAKYRASKLNATPNWANLIAIKEIYRTCHEGYHVDHIVPLQNDLVCGLHCEFNLQHLPARENLSKGNKFEID